MTLCQLLLKSKGVLSIAQVITQQPPAQKVSSIENQYTSTTISQEQIEVLNQLLKPEVQESLTVLIENLPKGC